MASYRSVHVQITVGKAQTFVGVVAREVVNNRRRDRLVYRAAVDVPHVESVERLLRAAAAELIEAADRL